MVQDDIGPEPERYYDWMLWKLKQSPKWQEAKSYSKKRKKEERAKKPKTEKEILMMDISELTKAYYGVLKRNKELSEENQKLKQQLDSNPLHGPEYRQRYHT